MGEPLELFGAELEEQSLEIGEETEEKVSGTLPKKRPRARRASEDLDPVSVPVNCYGAVTVGATYWACHKAGLGGQWETLAYGAPGESVELREWPLAQLSEETILHRWGPGTYRIQWLTSTPRGGRKQLSYGRVFTLRAPEVAPPAPVSLPTSPMGESFDVAMKVIAMIEAQSTSKVTGLMQMAQAMGGGGKGLGAAELQLILQNQANATKDAVAAATAAAVAPLQSELASLRAAQAAANDDDGDGPIGAVAQAAAPLIRGKGGWAQVLNFAAANPKVLEVALPIVADLASKVAAVFTPKPAPVAPAPAAQVVRPRAMVENAPVAPVVASPPPVENGSLSSWRPAPAPAAAASPAADVPPVS